VASAVGGPRPSRTSRPPYRRGTCPPDTDPAQVAFALVSIATGMNPARLLHGDADVADWALRVMHRMLGLPDSVHVQA
jgi:hypothetical protein